MAPVPEAAAARRRAGPGRRPRRFAAVLLVALAGCAGAPPSARGVASGIDRAAIDVAVRPQDDFFEHANGRWLRDTPFPPDRSYLGSVNELRDATRDELRAILEAPAGAPAGSPADADDAKLKALVASFADTARIERLGRAPLEPELARIDAVGDRRALVALFAHLARLGARTPLAVEVGQDDRDANRYVAKLRQSGLGLPDRDYYLDDRVPRLAAARAAYLRYLAQLLGFGGAAPAAAERDADAVLGLETALARAQWSAVEQRDPVKAYNPVAVDRLDALAPSLDWPAWLAAAGLAGRADPLIVRQPSYVTALGGLLERVPLATWRAYARARLIDACAPFGPQALVDARFAFAGTALTGATENVPRWERGVRLADGVLGDALGRRYVERYFPPASRARVEALVANLLAACRERLARNDWMSPSTRAEALAKLARFHTKIGYPTRWRDYAGLEIRADDLLGNVLRSNRFEHDRELAHLGRPVDRDEWFMTPQTVNAYYDESMNEIVFPAAFLQPPFFDPAADDAANYGSLGAVIGHEISHGFDDDGSRYDGDGNLRDWWTPEDRARFEARTGALVQQYDAFVAVLPDQHVNGRLTLGENIADNAGLALAWDAWRRSLGGREPPVIDGLSGAERFFLGYAQSWRGKARDAALIAQLRSDPHAPDRFRVIGAVRNQPEFHRTFGTRPGDAMYLAPEARVSIW